MADTCAEALNALSLKSSRKVLEVGNKIIPFYRLDEAAQGQELHLRSLYCSTVG